MIKATGRWELLAIYERVDYGRGSREVRYEDKLVATFSSKRAAQAYVRASYLKRPSPDQRFRRKSLLKDCHSYEIQEEYIEEPEIPPHDPKL